MGLGGHDPKCPPPRIRQCSHMFRHAIDETTKKCVLRESFPLRRNLLTRHTGRKKPSQMLEMFPAMFSESAVSSFVNGKKTISTRSYYGLFQRYFNVIDIGLIALHLYGDVFRSNYYMVSISVFFLSFKGQQQHASHLSWIWIGPLSIPGISDLVFLYPSIFMNHIPSTVWLCCLSYIPFHLFQLWSDLALIVGHDDTEGDLKTKVTSMTRRVCQMYVRRSSASSGERHTPLKVSFLFHGCYKSFYLASFSDWQYWTAVFIVVRIRWLCGILDGADWSVKSAKY